MRLYFLRHGAADWLDWDQADEERPLTKQGRKEVNAVGEFLGKLKVNPDVILSSPLPRAVQTADIAAAHLKVRVHEEKLLAPGFRFEELTRLLRKYPQQVLMLVGHEPDFTLTIGALTGASLRLAKAGVALVDLNLQKGKLLWLLPPKVFRRATQT